jgi:hypothetical protein
MAVLFENFQEWEDTATSLHVYVQISKEHRELKCMETFSLDQIEVHHQKNLEVDKFNEQVPEIPGHYHTVQTRELQVASSSWEQRNIASQTKGPQRASYIPGNTSIRWKIQ